jgi:iron complex outermembrane receptor protein
VSASAQADLVLEEVIVTAQKREQTVQDVPSSVNAFTEEMLSKSNTRSFSDLNNIASGVTITGGPGGFGQVIRIRGVGTNAFVPAIRPAVGIFIDNIPLAQSESAYTNMADIERVEVLKGPQATLFGKEVSSGAISMTARRPSTDAMDGYVEANFGNLGLQEYRLGGNLPLGDMFAIRGSVYSNHRDGTHLNIATGDDDMAETDGIGYRVRLLFEPTDDLSMMLGYEDHDVDVYGSNSVAREYGDLYSVWERNIEGITDPANSKLIIHDPYDRVTDHNASTDRTTKTEIISLHINYAFNDSWSFSSVTADQEYSIKTVGIDGSGGVNSNGINVPATADTSVGPYKLNDFFQDSGTKQFSHEMRLAFDNDSWSSIFGMFYADTEIVSYVPFTGLVLPINPNFIIRAAGESDLGDDVTEWALFNHNIWSIRDGLDLTFGIRYSDVEKESVKGQLVGTGPLIDLHSPFIDPSPWADRVPVQKNSWDEFTWTIKLTYWLNDEVSLYGGWDRGFKAGGHNVCKNVTGPDRRSLPDPDCPEPFESETADNFELGFKGRFLNETLVWNASVFYQTYDNYQVDIQDEEGIGNSIKNAAKVQIQGTETEFQWLVSENLRVDGNFSYVDARWDEYEDAGCLRAQFQRVACDPDTLVQDLSGKRLNYTSPWTANLNATWSDELANGMTYYIRGEIAFRDDRLLFPDLDPDIRDSSYSLLNASIGFSGPSANWDVIIWGKNLADEDYLLSASRNRDASPGSVNPTPVEGFRVIVGDERTFGVTLKYRFGEDS